MIKTKPHKRTIITYGIIGGVGLVGFIASFFIPYLIVKVLSIITCVCFLLASAFAIVKEYLTYIALQDDTLIFKGLFGQKEVKVEDIKRIEKTISSYNFVNISNKLFVSVDIDLVNLNNIIEELKIKFEIQVYTVA